MFLVCLPQFLCFCKSRCPCATSRTEVGGLQWRQKKEIYGAPRCMAGEFTYVRISALLTSRTSPKFAKVCKWIANAPVCRGHRHLNNFCESSNIKVPIEPGRELVCCHCYVIFQTGSAGLSVSPTWWTPEKWVNEKERNLLKWNRFSSLWPYVCRFWRCFTAPAFLYYQPGRSPFVKIRASPRIA